MLTTEKLFRGDTEFALMEKVRKAEVPPPSNFNRRVTAELDAISLKALARDVADRYQSAAALAADLDALIAGYRFDPKELRQFMRQLFRKEYAKEIEESETSLDAEPGSGEVSMHVVPGSRPGTVPGMGTPTETVPRNMVPGIRNPSQITPTTNPVVQQPAAPSQPESPPEDPDKPRGFWGSLFKKRK
jgi:hypothetical protein